MENLSLVFLTNSLIIIGIVSNINEEESRMQITKPLIFEGVHIRYDLTGQIDIDNELPYVIIEVDKIVYSTKTVSEKMIKLWKEVYNED